MSDGSPEFSKVVSTARDYYNSEDADRFYATIWGGEDIHIGLYESGEDSIPEASHRTVARIADKLGPVSAKMRILDIGSGYGGGARYLAERFGCHVTALNLSEVENARARELNVARGLADRIDVIDGSFETVPSPDASFDIVWSQDAILHSGERERVLKEVVRVLKPGGLFVFTDPMQADDCPAGVLDPILARIHLQSLGSPGFYREVCTRLGLVEEEFVPLTNQLVMHYSRVLQETERRAADLDGKVDPGYIERMKNGLRHWVDGGERGHLAWGIFRFRKS